MRRVGQWRGAICPGNCPRPVGQPGLIAVLRQGIVPVLLAEATAARG